MRAVLVDDYGGPETMRVAEVREPELGTGQSAVRVHAAGVNPVDWKLRAGKTWPVLRLKFPSQLGFEFAGEIVGSGARVFGTINPALGRGGSYADCVVVPTVGLLPVPEPLSMDEASTLPIAGVAAWMSLHELGRFEPGHRVLVLGASGGVGSMLVQLAAHAGGHVVGVCSQPHAELAHRLGCARVIDYTATDPLEDHQLYDLVVDCTGHYRRSRCRQRLTPRGVFITLVPTPGALLAACRPGRRRTRVVVGRPTQERLRAVANCVASGALRPVIGHRFALEEIADAHRLSESGRATGKIVVRMLPEGS